MPPEHDKYGNEIVDSAPPLEDLIERRAEEADAVDREEFHFHLGGQHYHIQPKIFAPTFRHKLYWFLRKLIDWIHP